MSGKSSRTRPVSVRLNVQTVEVLDAMCEAAQKNRGQVLEALIRQRAWESREALAAMAQLCSIRSSVVESGLVDTGTVAKLDILIDDLAPRVIKLIANEH